MKSTELAAVLILTLTAPAFAADAPAKPGPAPAAAKPADKAAKPEDKLICRREEETGSFIPKRVCKTQAQIDQERRDAQQVRDDRDAFGGRADQAPSR